MDARMGWTWRNRMTRIWIGAALACLLGGLGLSTPVVANDRTSHTSAHAHTAHLSLDRPQTSQRAARLRGAAPGRQQVVLQRHAHGVWRDVRVVPVRHG